MHTVRTQFTEVRCPEATRDVEPEVHFRTDCVDGSDAPRESGEVATKLSERVLKGKGVEMSVVESYATAERESSDLI